MEIKTTKEPISKTAIITVADLHINSTVALSPPVVNLDDGGTYHSSRTQHWLWSCWMEFITSALSMTDGYKRVVVINGDLTELDTQKRSIQLISMNKNTILSMVGDVICPLISFVDAVYIMRGTAAHTGKSAWSEEAVAGDLDNCVRKGDGNHSWWHYRGVASGVKLDIAHHAQMGFVPWSRKNAANNLAAKIMWFYQVDRNEPAPDLVIRSHNHTYASSGDNYKCQVDYLPSWTTLTEYGYRQGYENMLSDIGGIVYFCENGKFTKEKIFYKPKEARRVWQLSM